MKKFNPKLLPYIAAGAQTLIYGHAGYVLIDWIGAIMGGILGAVVSFSVAYAGSQIASIRGVKRTRLASVAMWALMAVSPLALVTPLYISFAHIELKHARIITAAMWAAAPDLAILLSGLVTGKKLVADPNGEQPKKSQQRTRSEPTAKTFITECSHCEWESKPKQTPRKAQNALNAHMRKHAKDIQ